MSTDRTRCDRFWEQGSRHLDAPGPTKGHHHYLQEAQIPGSLLLHEYIHMLSEWNRDARVLELDMAHVPGEQVALALGTDAIFAVNVAGYYYIDPDTCAPVDSYYLPDAYAYFALACKTSVPSAWCVLHHTESRPMASRLLQGCQLVVVAHSGGEDARGRVREACHDARAGGAREERVAQAA